MQFINNYMKINVEPRMKRIAGVGEFNVLGIELLDAYLAQA